MNSGYRNCRLALVGSFKGVEGTKVERRRIYADVAHVFSIPTGV